jgi:serine phosphatase RsbU (regulator of sigma subunit)
MCQEGVRTLTTGGPVVGAFENVRYEEATLKLYPDDVLVVFSDGITEALDPAGIEFGDERLLASVEANRALPPQSLLEHLLDDVRQFTATNTRHDDQTALILRYSGA